MNHECLDALSSTDIVMEISDGEEPHELHRGCWIIWQVEDPWYAFRIAFCPFCGVKLELP